MEPSCIQSCLQFGFPALQYKQETPMTISLQLKIVGPELEQWMKRLYPGDTITLTDAEGLPLAVLVPLASVSAPTPLSSDWNREWDELAQAVSHAWRGDVSATQTLAEMRR